jgi:hypothetical protein
MEYKDEGAMWADMALDSQQENMEAQLAATSIALPTTIQQKELFKERVRDQIVNGTLNPLEFYRQAKLITDCVDDLKKDGEVMDCAMSEIAKYGKEKPSINGSIVDKGSKTTYDYKVCGDKVWEDLKEQLAVREKFLKAIPSGGLVVTDPSTGETVTLMPPMAKVSEYITVKI